MDIAKQIAKSLAERVVIAKVLTTHTLTMVAPKVDSLQKLEEPHVRESDFDLYICLWGRAC